MFRRKRLNSNLRDSGEKEEHDALETPDHANVDIPRSKKPFCSRFVAFVLFWREAQRDFVGHTGDASLLN